MKFPAFLAAIALAPLASAQGFPAKPIRVVVPYPPGVVDLPVRLMAPSMQQEMGQPLIIDNRPGASGAIGIEMVARAAPDGYTLLAVAAGNLLVSPLVQGSAPFDSIKDFTPITTLYNAPLAVVVKTSLPASNLREFLDYAKKNPGKVTFGSAGPGTAPHLEGEMLKRVAGIDMLHVPYKGFPQIFTALLTQELDFASVSIGPVRPMILSGKVRLIAMHNGKAPRDLPQAPDLAQAVPGFLSAPNWLGLLGPAGMPGPVLARLNAAAVRALKAPDVSARLEESGNVIGADTPEEFAAALRASYDTSARIVKGAKDAGVKFE